MEASLINKTAFKAFLFDLNGTMIDDMEYHIIAWHDILNELGAGISYERTKAACYGKNNEGFFPDVFRMMKKQK
jgi:beta-phosphoglucomutase